MRKPAQKTPKEPRRVKRFTQAGALLGGQMRGAGAGRGFAEVKLLTRWAEICGAEIAAIARPVRVSYARQGFGATLTVACPSARAPEVAMQTDEIRDRVNACYGYHAISRVRLTQEDDAGFAEAQSPFLGQSLRPISGETTPEAQQRAAAATDGVGDPALRRALEALGTHVLEKGDLTTPGRTPTGPQTKDTDA